MGLLDDITKNLDMDSLPFDVETQTFDGTIESLESYIDKLEQEESGFQEGQPHINSVDQADYILGRIKALKEEVQEVEELGAKKVEKVKEAVEKWVHKSTSNNRHLISHYEGMLAAFVSQQLQDSKKKSLNFTNGTAGFRAQQPKFTYDDETLLASVKSLPEDVQAQLVKIKESVDKTKLKKALNITDGTPRINDIEVDGVTVESQPDAFYTK